MIQVGHNPDDPVSLSRYSMKDMTIIAEKLKYATHQEGKWDEGMAIPTHLSTRAGDLIPHLLFIMTMTSSK